MSALHTRVKRLEAAAGSDTAAEELVRIFAWLSRLARVPAHDAREAAGRLFERADYQQFCRHRDVSPNSFPAVLMWATEGRPECRRRAHEFAG